MALISSMRASSFCLPMFRRSSSSGGDCEPLLGRTAAGRHRESRPSGAHKGKTRFDPYDFDVDLYVAVDQETYDNIRRSYPHLDSDDTKLMPSETEPEDLVRRSKETAFPYIRGTEESVIALRVEQPW